MSVGYMWVTAHLKVSLISLGLSWVFPDLQLNNRRQPREAHFSPRLNRIPSDRRWAWQHRQRGLIKTIFPTNNNKLSEGLSSLPFPTQRHCSSQEASIRDALPQQVLIPGSSLHFHRQGGPCKSKGPAREALLFLQTWDFHPPVRDSGQQAWGKPFHPLR